MDIPHFINKSLNSNIRDTLQRGIDNSFKTVDEYYDPWLTDFDEEEGVVYFNASVNHEYKTWRVSYTMNEDATQVTFGDDLTEVVSQRTYTEVNTEKSLTDKIVSKVINVLKGNNDLTRITTFDDEHFISVEPLYIAADGVDIAGDTYTLEDTEFMVKSFNEVKPPMWLFHNVPAIDKEGNPIVSVEGEAWINKEKGTTFDGVTEVPVNQPLVKIKYHSEAAWNLRKEGILGAPSIGCRACYEDIENAD